MFGSNELTKIHTGLGVSHVDIFDTIYAGMTHMFASSALSSLLHSRPNFPSLLHSSGLSPQPGPPSRPLSVDGNATFLLPRPQTLVAPDSTLTLCSLPHPPQFRPQLQYVLMALPLKYLQNPTLSHNLYCHLASPSPCLLTFICSRAGSLLLPSSLPFIPTHPAASGIP